MKNEIRYTAAKELRIQTATDGTRTISGMIPYNSRSCDLGYFTETIAPGAFAGALAPGADVLCLRDHDAKLLMGRSTSSTLVLTDSPAGLTFRCALPKTQSAIELAESIDTGAVAGSITGGAQLIAQSFYPLLTQAQKSWGALTTILNVKKTDNGAPMKVALENDTTNILTVIGEGVAVSEADPVLSGLISSTDFCSTGVVKVSLAELQDSAFDLDQFIRDAFGKRYWRGAVSMISGGSTSGNVQSIVTAATVGATSAAPTAISYADFVSIYGALDPAYIDNASWVFNSSTRAALMGVVDTLGRPLFQPSPNSGAFDTLLGRPVVLNQYQPSIAATNKAVLFGDFASGYTFRQVQGDLSILRLNERYADTGEVGFIGYARIGGFSTDAGTHPIVALQQHA